MQQKKLGGLILFFYEKKQNFRPFFNAFYGQRSVTAAWATRSPWSIYHIFISTVYKMNKCVNIFRCHSETSVSESVNYIISCIPHPSIISYIPHPSTTETRLISNIKLAVKSNCLSIRHTPRLGTHFRLNALVTLAKFLRPCKSSKVGS